MTSSLGNSRSIRQARTAARGPLVLFAAVAFAFSTVFPGVADAHSCVVVARLTRGEKSVVPVQAAAETSIVTKVEVTVPAGFRVTSVPAKTGWTIERQREKVTFSGGRVPALGCGTFNLEGVAEEAGTLVFPVTVSSADGTTTEYAGIVDSDPLAGQIVEVRDPERGSGPVGPAAILGVLTVAVLGLVVFVSRRGTAAEPDGSSRRADRPRKQKPKRR